MLSAINIPVFLFSLIFGLLYMYFVAPKNKEIIVYPTDDNRELFQFRDKINNCFQLEQSIIKCSNDVEVIPIQI
ncbi:hypothetical protein N8261_03420 [Flavobacteriaceae bacterium]|nr:hypothetical protein [Flavobacteriaceae bacterium]